MALDELEAGVKSATEADRPGCVSLCMTVQMSTGAHLTGVCDCNGRWTGMGAAIKSPQGSQLCECN